MYIEREMQWTIFCNGFERLKSVQIVDLPSSHVKEKNACSVIL